MYSFLRQIDPANEEPLGWFDIFVGASAYKKGEAQDLSQVGMRVLDDFSLVMYLERPIKYFLMLVESLYPLPRHVIEIHGDSWADLKHIVTNGPFKIETLESEKYIKFVRNPAYHGRFPGNVDSVKVNFAIPTHPFYGLELYERNQADWVYLNNKTYVARQDYPDEYITGPAMRLFFIGFNHNLPLFKDPRVRQAFVLAADREHLVDELTEGRFKPATGGFLVPGIPGHSPEIGLPYEPELGAMLLAEAGYPDGKNFPELEILWPSENKLLERIAEQWSINLGVDVSVKQEKWKRILELYETRELYFQGTNIQIPDPEFNLDVKVTQWAPAWKNKDFERALQEAQASSDQGQRIRSFKEADKILISEAVFMPIYYVQDHYLVKPWVRMPATSSTWNLEEIILEPH
jgi:oligopeptide transport system substrate-binding protein